MKSEKSSVFFRNFADKFILFSTQEKQHFMANDTRIFWDWFREHTEELTMLSEYDESKQNKLLDEMQAQLEKYCEALTFEISEPSKNGRRVTFTAEGDIDFFDELIRLTDEAPDIDWWEFIPFKQPCGNEVKVHFDKYSFDSKKMHFMQLECEEEPDILGLRVAFDNADPDNEDQQIGTYVTLEAMIGEFDCATLIGYLEICPTPQNPKEEGFLPLADFPNFVEWFKDQRDK